MVHGLPRPYKRVVPKLVWERSLTVRRQENYAGYFLTFA